MEQELKNRLDKLDEAMNKLNGLTMQAFNDTTKNFMIAQHNLELAIQKALKENRLGFQQSR